MQRMPSKSGKMVQPSTLSWVRVSTKGMLGMFSLRKFLGEALKLGNLNQLKIWRPENFSILLLCEVIVIAAAGCLNSNGMDFGCHHCDSSRLCRLHSASDLGLELCSGSILDWPLASQPLPVHIPSRLGLDAGVLGDLPTSAQENNSQSSVLAFLSTSISTSDTLTISTSDFPSQYLIPGTVGPGGWGCFFCFFFPDELTSAAIEVAGWWFVSRCDWAKAQDTIMQSFKRLHKNLG